MQIDEIARHVETDRIAPLATVERPQDETVDQDGRPLAGIAARDQPFAILQRAGPHDQLLQFGLLGIGQFMP